MERNKSVLLCRRLLAVVLTLCGLSSSTSWSKIPEAFESSAEMPFRFLIIFLSLMAFAEWIIAALLIRDKIKANFLIPSLSHALEPLELCEGIVRVASFYMLHMGIQFVVIGITTCCPHSINMTTIPLLFGLGIWLFPIFLFCLLYFKSSFCARMILIKSNHAIQSVPTTLV